MGIFIPPHFFVIPEFFPDSPLGEERKNIWDPVYLTVYKIIRKLLFIDTHWIPDKFLRWSDIDVCVVSPRFKDEFEAIQFLLARRNKREVMAGLEPIGFSAKSFREGSSLIKEIKKTRVEIFI